MSNKSKHIHVSCVDHLMRSKIKTLSNSFLNLIINQQIKTIIIININSNFQSVIVSQTNSIDFI
jgi:hypothetical protein